MTPETLRPFLPALILALLATLFGQAIGIGFGAAEDRWKAGLRADAEAVLSTVYGGDAEKVNSVVGRSFTYLKRAHMHAGALGAAALVLTLVMAFVPGPLLARRGVALGNALGALGYGTFWLMAGQRAPGLGGTDAAKESLAWLALPSSGLLVLTTVAAIVLLVLAAVRPAAR
ncbi:MAG: hypothetical protein IT382_20505 [Deltaproteobacteria bacterium]|nr:hypothetical protein [Deltaproteobacteria bacterium]